MHKVDAAVLLEDWKRLTWRLDKEFVEKFWKKWSALNAQHKAGELTSGQYTSLIGKLIGRLNKKQLVSVLNFADYGFRNNNDVYYLREDILNFVIDGW